MAVQSQIAKPHFDVVLVQPNITWVYDPFEHLGLAYLAGALRGEGFSVKIIDAVLLKLPMSELYKELDSLDIGILGVTLISHGYPVTVRFLEYYRPRHPETTIIGGGHFATFAASKILAHTRVFDAIFLGESEISLGAYCKSVLRGEAQDLHDIAFPDAEPVRSGNRIVDMDSLPFPSRDCLTLAMQRGANPAITSSRGCYARCSFCTVHNFYTAKNGPRWVARSIDSVVEELRFLRSSFGIEHFMFVDDNFIGPGKNGKNRAIEFAEAYRRSGLPMTFHIDCRAVDVDEDVIRELKGTGLTSVFLGIESVASNDLVLYRKDLRSDANWKAVEILKKYDLIYTLSMIMFNPDTTEQAILDNCQFLRSAGYYPRNPLSVLNIYEGTDLSKTHQAFMHGPFWDYHFDFARPSIEAIYKESLRFSKDTLPLERELSVRPDFAIKGRQRLHQIRLLHLEDLTRSLRVESAETIYQRWWKQILLLRESYGSDAAPSAADARFGVERIYMTGSPLDSPSTCDQSSAPITH